MMKCKLLLCLMVHATKCGKYISIHCQQLIAYNLDAIYLSNHAKFDICMYVQKWTIG